MNIKKVIKVFLFRILKAIKKLRYLLLDIFEIFLSRKDKLMPPRRLRFVGGGSFKNIGEEFLRYFIDLAGLKNTDRVLDVGCGIGRMAIPLTKYLSKEGSYEGFDIVSRDIKWCNNHITPQYPNFKFQLSDISNTSYNPKGKYKAVDYRFPYPDKSFDFVFLTSVFTHMLPSDIENYLSEISRVLKASGKMPDNIFSVK